MSARIGGPGRLLKRLSQATTEVAPTGQEVSLRHGTWVEMTVEDSDNDDEALANPVESDDYSDCVLDALQRDLGCCRCPSFRKGRRARVSHSVKKSLRVVSPTPQTTQLEGESAIVSRRSASAIVLLQHEGPVGLQWRGTQKSTIPRVTAPRVCVKFHVENDWYCCRESVWVWFRRITSPLQVRPRAYCATETRFESRSSKSRRSESGRALDVIGSTSASRSIYRHSAVVSAGSVTGTAGR